MPASAAPSRLPIAVLVAIVLLGGAMRFWQARESLWLDELHTAWCAMGSLAEVAPRATLGNQSPLFFWLEWLLVQLLGPSELTVRLPSLVAGSLLPVALFCLIRRWTDATWLGILAAWLVVVDPVQIFYATEARPYALVQLLAVIHIALLAEILLRDSVRLHVAFILVGALLFHLHYTAALLFPAEIVAVTLLAAWSRGQPPAPQFSRTFWMLGRDSLVIAVLCLPAAAHVIAIFERRTNWEMFVPEPKISSFATLLPWTWAAAIVLVGQGFRLSRRMLDQDEARPSILSFCWLIVPLLIAWIFAKTGIARLFFLRYLMVSAPAAIILAVLAVRMTPWRTPQIAAALIVALAAVLAPLVPQLTTDTDRRGDWRSAIAHFNEQPGHDRHPVLVATQLIEADALRGPHDPELAAYCLYPVHSLYSIKSDPAITIPLPRTDPGQLSADGQGLVRTHGAAWLIFAGNDEATEAAEQAMLASLAEVGGRKPEVGGQRSEVGGRPGEWHVESRASFGTVHILLFRQL